MDAWRRAFMRIAAIVEPVAIVTADKDMLLPDICSPVVAPAAHAHAARCDWPAPRATLLPLSNSPREVPRSRKAMRFPTAR